MLDVVEITIEEFEDNIYSHYIELFPKDEQRNWKNVTKTYNLGIEKFYKIVVDDKTIGFFMLEKIDNYPYYLDYFAIYKEYQNMNYGSKSLSKLIEKVGNIGLLGEIEEVKDDLTKRRFEFYKRLGFRKIGSLYLLFNVYYEPIVVNCDLDKESIDKMFMTYYTTNSGEEAIKKNGKFIK